MYIYIHTCIYIYICIYMYIYTYIFGVTYAYIWQIETCYGVCQSKIGPLQVFQHQTLLFMAYVCALWSGGIG